MEVIVIVFITVIVFTFRYVKIIMVISFVVIQMTHSSFMTARRRISQCHYSIHFVVIIVIVFIVISIVIFVVDVSNYHHCCYCYCYY